MNILFICAGRRNYLINYFKQALSGKGQVFATDMQRSPRAMADADQAFLVPSIYDANYSGFGRHHISEPCQSLFCNNLSWEKKLALDVWDVDHRSLLLDLKILARTVGTVVSAEGINAPSYVNAQEFKGSGK